MKNEEKQGLRISQWTLGLGLVVLAGFLSLPSWTRQREEERVLNAKRHAEVLGYQVFEIYRDASRNSSIVVASDSRAPASVNAPIADISRLKEGGSIGNDPWGQPYHYKILSAAADQLKVQIWSAGPNKKFETADEPGVAADSYAGDDIGIILSMNHKPSE
jgi:hypothetical protein